MAMTKQEIENEIINNNTVSYANMRRIQKTINYYTGDPEITADVVQNIEYEKREKSIFILELEEIDEIKEKFQEIYIKHEERGLQETTITPEMYNDFILKTFKDYIEYEAGASCTVQDNRIIFHDEIQAISDINYYITNEPHDYLTETIEDVIFNHWSESEDLLNEIDGFIYWNSLYNDEY